MINMQYGNGNHQDSNSVWCPCEYFMDDYNRSVGFCSIDYPVSEAPHVSPSDLVGLSDFSPNDWQPNVYRNIENGNGPSPSICTVMDRNQSWRIYNGNSTPSENFVSQNNLYGQHSQKVRRKGKRVTFWGDFEGAKKPPARNIAIFNKDSKVGHWSKISYV